MTTRFARRFRPLRTAVAVVAGFTLGACRSGTDPEPSAPRGLLVAAKGDTLVTMNLDGAHQRRFPNIPAIAQYGLHPTWAALNRIVVHTATAASGSAVRLHVLDLGTGALTPLTPASSPLAAEWYPHWSAGWVSFMGETSAGTFEMWRVRADGTGMAKRAATSPDYGNYYRPVPSPDGTKIAAVVVNGGRVGVIVADASTGQVLAPWVGDATAPRWSRDGRHVAFSTPGAGPIRMMAADGSGLRTITQGPFQEWFDWSADGSWIVVSSASGLMLVRVANGGDQRPLPNTRGMWQPAVTAEPGLD